MTGSRKKADLDHKDIVSFLQKNPHFFADYPELAANMQLPSQHGKVVSLVHYQVARLRKENRGLVDKLGTLVDAAQKNEQLIWDIHAFNLGLYKQKDAKTLISYVVDNLTSQFGIDCVCLVLFSAADNPPVSKQIVYMQQGMDDVAELADVDFANGPQVGRFPASVYTRLFTKQASAIKSAALIGLEEEGILALGSFNEDHFHPGMGNMFLRLVGDSVHAALLHFQVIT